MKEWTLYERNASNSWVFVLQGRQQVAEILVWCGWITHDLRTPAQLTVGWVQNFSINILKYQVSQEQPLGKHQTLHSWPDLSQSSSGKFKDTLVFPALGTGLGLLRGMMLTRFYETPKNVENILFLKLWIQIISERFAFLIWMSVFSLGEKQWKRLFTMPALALRLSQPPLLCLSI